MKVFTSADAEGFSDLYSIYRSVFPDENETEDMDGIRASLALVGDEALVSRYGRFEEFWIADGEEGRFRGGVNYTSFEIPSLGITTAHINYLFTARAERRRGTGSALLEKVKEQSGAAYIFCEQNDPDFMTEEEIAEDFTAAGISMRDRLLWWNRRGFGRLDMRYIQPPLSPGKEAAKGMSLNVWPSSDSVPSGVVEEHLRRFFYISVLKNRTQDDPFTERLLSDILERESIPVSVL